LQLLSSGAKSPNHHTQPQMFPTTITSYRGINNCTTMHQMQQISEAKSLKHLIHCTFKQTVMEIDSQHLVQDLTKMN
jgi:hypothetical protein